MADKKPKASSVITLGGKGSSLSAASVFAVANDLAQVRIDSSILDKLKSSSSSNRKSPPVKFHIPIPKILTFEESRAFLLALLNKLLLSGSASTVLPVLISNVLNAGSKNLDLGEVEVSAEEVVILDKSCACLYGICGILDYESSALSTIADVVAAMSSEASKADVGALNLMDSGDGLSVKDEVGVASDLKVLLNGSKLVGKVEVDAVSEIPKIHGSLREVVRMVLLKTRVELNSGGKSISNPSAKQSPNTITVEMESQPVGIDLQRGFHFSHQNGTPKFEVPNLQSMLSVSKFGGKKKQKEPLELGSHKQNPNILNSQRIQNFFINNQSNHIFHTQGRRRRREETSFHTQGRRRRREETSSQKTTSPSRSPPSSPISDGLSVRCFVH